MGPSLTPASSPEGNLATSGSPRLRRPPRSKGGSGTASWPWPPRTVTTSSLPADPTQRPTIPARGTRFASAVRAYRRLHEVALDEACRLGRCRDDESRPMAKEAAAQHYLTDAFAAGHLRTPVTAIRHFWHHRYPQFWQSLQRKVAASATASSSRVLAKTWPSPAVRAGIDDVEVAYRLGVSGSRLRGEALYRAVRSATGASHDAFRPEIQIPTLSADNPCRTDGRGMPRHCEVLPSSAPRERPWAWRSRRRCASGPRSPAGWIVWDQTSSRGARLPGFSSLAAMGGPQGLPSLSPRLHPRPSPESQSDHARHRRHRSRFVQPAPPRTIEDHGRLIVSVRLAGLSRSVTGVPQAAWWAAGHLSRGSVPPVSSGCTACAASSSVAGGCPGPPTWASARIRAAMRG
jgi:hypothetical protein